MTHARCQWPTTTDGGVLFCDAPVERGSYCGLCAAKAYQAPGKGMRDGDILRFVKYLERRGGA